MNDEHLPRYYRTPREWGEEGWRRATFWQRVSAAQTGLALCVALACFATAATPTPATRGGAAWHAGSLVCS